MYFQHRRKDRASLQNSLLRTLDETKAGLLKNELFAKTTPASVPVDFGNRTSQSIVGMSGIHRVDDERAIRPNPAATTCLVIHRL